MAEPELLPTSNIDGPVFVDPNDGRMTKTEVVKMRRRNRIARMLARGKTHRQIAETLGVSISSVTSDVKIIHAGWQAQQIRNFDEYLTLRLEQLRMIQAELWDAWDASCNVKGKEGQGNPRYLAEIRAAISDEIKLMQVQTPDRFVLDEHDDGTNGDDVGAADERSSLILRIVDRIAERPGSVIGAGGTDGDGPGGGHRSGEGGSAAG